MSAGLCGVAGAWGRERPPSRRIGQWYGRHGCRRRCAVEFRVLGDLEVGRDGDVIALGAHQQRAVLAVLVLHADEVVSSERLIDDLWGERPPATAAKTLHVYVSRLRKALSAEGPAAAAIVTRDHGYVLRVAPGQIDALVF